MGLCENWLGSLWGSGYVLIAYLQDELVAKRGWLTSAQIADTVVIFLPSFLFVLVPNPLIPKMRQSKNFSLLLDSINAGAVGLMAYALYPLGQVAFASVTGVAIFAFILLVLWRYPKVNSFQLIGVLDTWSPMMKMKPGLF